MLIFIRSDYTICFISKKIYVVTKRGMIIFYIFILKFLKTKDLIFVLLRVERKLKRDNGSF